MTEAERVLYHAIASGDDTRTLGLIRENPRFLLARLPGNATPLLTAAYRRNTSLVEGLLALGAQVDFISAIVLGRTAIVQEMLEQDPALIRKRSPSNWSTLHLATAYADREMIGLLLSLGANPTDARKDFSYTPLFFANRPPFENAGLLLAHGADINARAKHGATVLHSAAASGNEDWIDFLLAHGANPDIQTDARQTPWAIAVRYGRDRAAQRITDVIRDRAPK